MRMNRSLAASALLRAKMRRIALLASGIVVSACSRASRSDGTSTGCVTQPAPVDAWSTLVSPINGVAVSYPPAYAEKRWANRSSSNPSPSAADQRELWSLVELWLDDHPANRMSFGMARPTSSTYGGMPTGPVRSCDVRSKEGLWHARIFETGGPPNGGSPGFVVSARLVVPGDSMLLQFNGFAMDTVERERQLAVLGTFRPIPR